MLKLGQHYQFPNTNVLSDLIIELQEFLENKRSSLILKTCLTEREGRTRDEETKRHGKTEAGANGATTEEEEEEEERFDDFIVFFKKKLRAAGRHACRVKMISAHTRTHTVFSVRRSGQVSIDLFQEVRCGQSVGKLFMTVSNSLYIHPWLITSPCYKSLLSRRTQPTLKVLSTDGPAWVKL